ncbi:hypothetical protein [Niallia taxi]|uniref:hypothetical protein n=1 Tax=Niallia taxi TaxID=2499688 RepID=UPI0015F75D24|nr:hypothetical protein [Niallia taxi]
MATLLGIELRGFYQEEHDRGIYYEGKLFVDGEQIGVFENKGIGGCTDLSIQTAHRKAVYNKLQARFPEKQDVDLEEKFVEELIALHEAEEVYKEQNKPILLETYSYDDDTPITELTWEELGPKFYAPETEEEIELVITSHKPKRYNVYRSLADFQK